MFKKTFLFVAAFVFLSGITFADTMSVPTGQESFSYNPIVNPVISSNPSQAKPIGVGSIAEGGDSVGLKINSRFSGPVDIYVGIYAPEVDPNNIYIIKSDYSLRLLSTGPVPLKTNVTDINEDIFNNIPKSALPVSTYNFYIAVTPSGNIENYYLWTTAFNSGATGNLTAQEVGDAIYRPLPLSIDDHTGLYYRYIGGDPNNLMNHLVIQHPGEGSVRLQRKPEFLDNKVYFGAHTPSQSGKLLFSTRKRVLSSAIDLVNANIPYVPKALIGFLNVLIPDWTDNVWNGEATDIDNIRCDGVVEFSYEKNGIRVWGRESAKWNISDSVSYEDYKISGPFDSEKQCALWQHNDQNLPIEANELTPKSQRGGYGLGYTTMRPSKPDNPSTVFNLISTTHDLNGNPYNPDYKKIAIEWDDATDEQSGTWGYYIRVDSELSSIPDHNDIAFPKVKCNNIDSNSLDTESCLDPDFPDKNDYEPRWESDPLPNGLYFVHIRSIDNAGNWCADTMGHGCTAHLGPFLIGEHPRGLLEGALTFKHYAANIPGGECSSFCPDDLPVGVGFNMISEFPDSDTIIISGSGAGRSYDWEPLTYTVDFKITLNDITRAPVACVIYPDQGFYPAESEKASGYINISFSYPCEYDDTVIHKIIVTDSITISDIYFPLVELAFDCDTNELKWASVLFPLTQGPPYLLPKYLTDKGGYIQPIFFYMGSLEWG